MKVCFPLISLASVVVCGKGGRGESPLDQLENNLFAGKEIRPDRKDPAYRLHLHLSQKVTQLEDFVTRKDSPFTVEQLNKQCAYLTMRHVLHSPELMFGQTKDEFCQGLRGLERVKEQIPEGERECFARVVGKLVKEYTDCEVEGDETENESVNAGGDE